MVEENVGRWIQTLPPRGLGLSEVPGRRGMAAPSTDVSSLLFPSFLFSM